jgi:hypothetical protein
MREHRRETFRKVSTCENFRKFSITSGHTRGAVAGQICLLKMILVMRVLSRQSGFAIQTGQHSAMTNEPVNRRIKRTRCL